MLLPTALAVNEIVPSNLRAIGLLPFVMLLPAAGLVWAVDRLPAVAHARAVTVALPLVMLAVGGWSAGDAYFRSGGPGADVLYGNGRRPGRGGGLRGPAARARARVRRGAALPSPYCRVSQRAL